MQAGICSHLEAVKKIKISKTNLCEECVKTGSDWVHLRTCQTCGTTLCCDESPNKHMTKHFYQTSHPVITSAQPGERWMWCYVDEQFIEY
jgi:Zn-finger in ubiquitin-hydrolases and other protein